MLFQTSMWIHGTGSKKLRPPQQSDKAHGRGRGKSDDYWQRLICAAIGDGVLELVLSTITAPGLYRPQIAATLAITPEGRNLLLSTHGWSIPEAQDDHDDSLTSSQLPRKKRLSGGSNLVPVIEKLLLSSEKWYKIETTSQYQYPGVFSNQTLNESDESNSGGTKPRLGYVADCSKLPHYHKDNPHFLYSENQLSKGHYNDNAREVEIDGKRQQVRIRYAKCQGVLRCDFSGWLYLVKLKKS